MARTSTQQLTFLITASVLLLAGGALPVLAQARVPGTPTIPPPISILSITPDPGTPGSPNDGLTPVVSTPAPTDAKDMKDMKDMKQTVSYTTAPGDYFELWLTGSGTHGDMGSTADPGHFYFDRAQGNLGFAYHFAQDWTVGTIFSFAHTDSEYGEINASTTLDSYAPTLFVAYDHNGWFANLSTTESWDTFTTERGTPTGEANGGGSGFQYGGKLQGGYLFKNGPWSYGPVADFQGYHLNAAGFTEDGAGANDLHFNRENSLSMQSHIGFLARYDTECCGMHLQPYLGASWQHEYADANQQITGNTSAGAAFSGTSIFLDRDAAVIDLGVKAKVSSCVDLYLGYEGVVDPNYLTNTAQGGVSVSF
jgi:outer membrane autotransporter protein